MRNADGVRNLRKIIDDEQNLFIIVSAMGKTTNALEKVFEGLQKGDKQLSLEHVESLRKYHAEIIDELWHEPKRLPAVDALFGELEKVATETVYKPGDAELWYDTIVAYGELVSTTIISEYLNYAGVSNRWIDMRRCFLTEQRHKDAGVNIEASASLLKNALGKCVENIFIGQGFIGGAPDGTTTTLGREGSDYSAAVVANILDAESMSVWKDVDGVMNADPKAFPDAVQIAELNYLDTIELAYSGAQIIHPKTIKPLQNKNSPLYVRPFGDKRKPGTVIRGMSAPVDVPILILKKDQVLLTIRSRDFSFVLETDGYTSFSGSWYGPVIRGFDTSDYRFGHATHGHHPDRGPSPTLIAFGPSIKEGAVLKNCRLVDEAPTFAAALGFTMEGTDGRVLHEILK